jgi:cell division protein FtsW
MFIMSRVKYIFIRRHAFWILLFTAILSLLVFVPGIGMSHGGATRWIDLRITTFQPGELLKFGVVVYLATWLTHFKRKIHSPYFGITPLLVVLGIACYIFVAQRDTGSFLIAAFAGTGMFIAAGARWRDLVILFFVGITLLGALAVMRPYVRERFSTLIHHDDFQGSGYQLRQSLIAIGGGEIVGKGFGQGVQKFNYLPEADGDSIFAVFAEEFGFIGSVILVALYALFALRGFWIAARAPDTFSGLFAVGLVILIIAQSFINIASMLALAPLTGVPLVFISHGGTSLLVAMAEVGILLNISRYRLSA